MMHCRRRFYYAVKVLLLNGMSFQDAEATPEGQALERLRRIYEADTPLKELSPEIRLHRRQTVVRPLVDDFFAYIKSLVPDSEKFSSYMLDAIGYALRQERQLRAFLDDAEVPIDNGNCERAVRPFAICRRNCLFSFSELGATCLCMLFTLAQTALRNNADPWYYFKYLLEKLFEHYDDKGRGFVEDLLPWAPAYRQYEKKEKELRRLSTFRDPPLLNRLPPKLRQRFQTEQSQTL